MRYKPLSGLCGVMAGTIVALMLIGCNGGGGSTSSGGTNPVGPSNTINVSQLTPAEWAALKPQGRITKVAINGNPVVEFQLLDANGNGLKGLAAFTSKSATATVPSFPNLAFTIAKLVPQNAATKAPCKWVNYLVTSVPTTTTGVIPSRPTSDNAGTLVDHGDGSYTYTFYRDITKSQAILDAASYTGNNSRADLGDVSCVPTLTHRVVMQFSGNARGTGSNTSDGVTITTAVPILNPINVVFDFIPATGAPVTAADTSREIVTMSACFECHSKFTVHGGGRQDPRFCVTCHTDQRKYGYAEATIAGTVYSGTTHKINGLAVGDFPALIHRVHMGQDLTKTGYNYNNEVLFNEIGYPQLVSNCTKCHVTSVAQSANWKDKPSRMACGACHDDVDFATGTNHGGGIQTSDVACAGCHDSASAVAPITTAHISNNVTTLNPTTPAGVGNFTYDLKSVTLNASRQPVVTFRINLDGTPVTSFATPTTLVNANGGATVLDPAFQPIPGYVGGPSLYVAYAMPQDGITGPADFNVTSSVSLANLLVPSGSPKAGTLTGPDGQGYFTATLTGDLIGQPDPVNPVISASPITVSASAKMVTGAIIGSFTQINLANYPYTPGNVLVNPNVSASGGLVRPTLLKQVLATISGNTARRTVVGSAKCDSCHDQLGISPNFHSGARNDATACAFCHTPNRTSSGWSANASTFIHGIHGGSKRTVPFTWHAASATDTYANLLYPGVLNNCEQCHLPDTYNFGTTAATAALPNMLWSTVGTGTYPGTSASYTISPYVLSGSDYGAVYSYSVATGATTTAALTTLVNSPVSAACFSCHDSTSTKAHITLNGGSIYQPRSSAFANTETCLICHGAGTIADIKAVHQ